MDTAYKKKVTLKEAIKKAGKIAVAFSFGVDSTFLLKTVHEILGDNLIAITARACCFPKSETEEAEKFCKKEGIRQIILDFNPLEIDEFRGNDEKRCYYCKKALFAQIKSIAKENGFSYIAEGTNSDDLSDYRPGMKATKELGIHSPLLDTELTKNEIRFLSEKMGLPTYNKPSFACLASRIPYNEEITKEKLEMVEKAENKLHSLGFLQSRVRIHSDLARIEINRNEFENLIAVSDEINSYFKELGFTFISMDLEGYKTGKMNQNIKL
ncbi:MAG: ATP-dependent sacrificial sulfur transferase LarE [Eubacterium sp.]|nr:ATP-dependent sacrificial sulfur transferase LarE [Eubacterium sp.]